MAIKSKMETMNWCGSRILCQIKVHRNEMLESLPSNRNREMTEILSLSRCIWPRNEHILLLHHHHHYYDYYAQHS